MSTFIDFARAHGVDIDPAKVFASSRIRRCGTVDKPRSKNGAFFWDGARGWVWNWQTEARVQWFHDDKATPWTEAEKQAWKARRDALSATQDADHRRAATRAAELMRASQPGEHNYLHMKGFPDAQGMVAADGALLIPMRNWRTNEIQGLQVIRWIEADRKYEKKMLTGMKARGAVFRMGDKTASETFLVEGYVTGLSVVAALRSVGLRASVLVCFSSSNMVEVARQVPGRKFIYADHDASGTGEKAAQKTGFPYCMSDTQGNDANDDHQQFGLMAVCRKLMEVRRG